MSILVNGKYCVKTQFGASILDKFQGDLIVVSLADTLNEGVEDYHNDVKAFVNSLVNPDRPPNHAFTVKVVDSKKTAVLFSHPSPKE
jgi:hypothetical protein